jgi:hypothetical protein
MVFGVQAGSQSATGKNRDNARRDIHFLLRGAVLSRTDQQIEPRDMNILYERGQ